jgi:hypothetical protein
MLVGEGCEHLWELKKLALSCDASLLEDFHEDLDQIAKRLVKNWWTKLSLPFCMQKIEEENRVSFITLYFVWLAYVVWQSILVQPEASDNPRGEGAGEGDAAACHDAPKEISAQGASADGMTGNDAEAEVPAVEASVTKVLEANAAEILSVRECDFFSS